MTKMKSIWIVLIPLLVGVGYMGYTALTRINANPNEGAQNNSPETAVARIGDLTISASGSGEVVPGSEISLTFDEGGVVGEVLVHVGDRVQAGDVLMRLQRDVTQAELDAEIAAAELAFVQAQQNLAALYKNAEMEAAKALIELEDAQVALEDEMDLELEKSLALEAVAEAQGAIEKAEMRLYIYNSTPSEDEVYTAYASLLFKEANYEKTQSELERMERKIKGVKDDRMRKRFEDQILQLKVALANQQIVVDNATYKLNSMDEGADPLDVSLVEAQLQSAQLQLATAQKELAELQTGPDPGVIARAEARLKGAQADWDRLKGGPDPDEIARLETQLEKARLALEIARKDTAEIDLVAPIDGMVIALDASPGDRYTPGTGTSTSDTGAGSPQSEIEMFEALIFGNQSSTNSNASALITIADLSQSLIEAAVDETDFEKVAIGYPVEVTFEALPDETFTGTIVEISPQLETVSNTQGVRILVRLDADSYAKPIPLPIGLNASIDVIAGQAVNAVLVPVEALVTVYPQQTIVYVIENGEIQPREVSVGLIDFTSAEITEGIKAGEVVAIGYDQPSGN